MIRGEIKKHKVKEKEGDRGGEKQYSTVLISLNTTVGLLIFPVVELIEGPTFGKMKAERVWWKACTQTDIEPGLSGSMCHVCMRVCVQVCVCVFIHVAPECIHV